MNSVFVNNQLFTGAKSFISSLLVSVCSWTTNYSLGVGIFAIAAGMNSYQINISNMNINSIIPFASEISVILGIMLSSLGLVTKSIELYKTYKSRIKKSKKK